MFLFVVDSAGISYIGIINEDKEKTIWKLNSVTGQKLSGFDESVPSINSFEKLKVKLQYGNGGCTQNTQ